MLYGCLCDSPVMTCPGSLTQCPDPRDPDKNKQLWNMDAFKWYQSVYVNGDKAYFPEAEQGQ